MIAVKFFLFREFNRVDLLPYCLVYWVGVNMSYFKFCCKFKRRIKKKTNSLKITVEIYIHVVDVKKNHKTLYCRNCLFTHTKKTYNLQY